MTFKGKTYKLSVILPWIGLVVQGYKTKMFLNVVIGWLIIGLNFLFVWFTKQIIDAATTTHEREQMMRLCMMLVLTIVLQAVLSVFYKRGKTLIEFHLRRRMQQNSFMHVVAARWEDINAFHTGDIVRRIEYDGKEVTSFVTDTLPTILLVLLQLAGAFVFLFVLNERIAGMLALLMLAGVFVSKFHFLKIRYFSGKIKEAGSMLQAAFQENVQHLAVLKSLIDKTLVYRHIVSVFDTQERNVRMRLRYSIFSSTVLNIGFAACYLLVFIWGVFNLESGAITYGSLMAFVQLVGQIQGPSRTLIRSISDFAEFYTSCERMNEIDAIPRDGKSPRLDVQTAPEIRCDHVRYTYADNRKTIFEDFSHTFKASTFTAILGTTGTGKTTLMRLLLAYVRPVGGSITALCDGTERPVDTSTRSLFAYVPQGNTLFSVSLRDNLRLGNPEATEAQMHEALAWACADFVETLPNGLDTVCGEDGKELSQGQVQRICIARALLSPTPVLLMDEATSALDRNTEEQIIRNIRTHLSRKTILFITHRDTAIPYADEVLRISK